MNEDKLSRCWHLLQSPFTTKKTHILRNLWFRSCRRKIFLIINYKQFFIKYIFSYRHRKESLKNWWFLSRFFFIHPPTFTNRFHLNPNYLRRVSSRDSNSTKQIVPLIKINLFWWFLIFFANEDSRVFLEWFQWNYLSSANDFDLIWRPQDCSLDCLSITQKN